MSLHQSLGRTPPLSSAEWKEFSFPAVTREITSAPPLRAPPGAQMEKLKCPPLALPPKGFVRKTARRPAFCAISWLPNWGEDAETFGRKSCRLAFADIVSVGSLPNNLRSYTQQHAVLFFLCSHHPAALGTLVECWWNLGRTLVEPWWNPGEPW